jgi:hypothetical protein
MRGTVCSNVGTYGSVGALGGNTQGHLALCELEKSPNVRGALHGSKEWTVKISRKLGLEYTLRYSIVVLLGALACQSTLRHGCQRQAFHFVSHYQVYLL